MKHFQQVNADTSGNRKKKIEKARQTLQKFNFLEWLDDYIKPRRSAKMKREEEGIDSADSGDDDDAYDGCVYENDEDDGQRVDTNSMTMVSVSTNGISRETDPPRVMVIEEEINMGPAEYTPHFNEKREHEEERVKSSIEQCMESRDEINERIQRMKDVNYQVIGSVGMDRDEDKANHCPVDHKRSRSFTSPRSRVGDRDECDIFGELVATKIRKLSRQTQEEVQLAIESTLMQYRIRDERRSAQQSHCSRCDGGK